MIQVRSKLNWRNFYYLFLYFYKTYKFTVYALNARNGFLKFQSKYNQTDTYDHNQQSYFESYFLQSSPIHFTFSTN